MPRSRIMKIAVVTPIPTPYRDAFWNVVGEEPDTNLHLLYCATGKADRPWKTKWHINFHHKFLKGWNLLGWKSREASLYFNPEVIIQLNHIQPEKVLIGGYNHLTMLLAMAWSVMNGRDFYLMCETNHLGKSKGIRSRLKRLFIEAIGRKSAGGFPTGKSASRYLQFHGWEKDSLSYLPNVPDINGITKKLKLLRAEGAQIRSKWKIKDEKIIIYVGRLIKKKNVDHLIKAIANINPESKLTLVVIGEGDQAQDLKSLSQKLGTEKVTRFLGFLEPEAILEWFALASVFVLPSNETWGVAPIEAASAGLHLILSENVGSAFEISDRYSKIHIVQEGNIQQWQTTILNAIDSNHDCGEGQHASSSSQNLLQDWSYSALASRMLTFLTSKRRISSV